MAEGTPLTLGPPPRPRRSSPSPSEAKAIADAQERTAARQARIAVLAEAENGALRIRPPHSDDAGFAARLLDAFGTKSPSFANRAMERLGTVMRPKGTALPNQTEFNAALAAVDGIRPTDEIEAMLAVQMVATYEMAMDMQAERLSRGWKPLTPAPSQSNEVTPVAPMAIQKPRPDKESLAEAPQCWGTDGHLHDCTQEQRDAKDAERQARVREIYNKFKSGECHLPQGTSPEEAASFIVNFAPMFGKTFAKSDCE